MWVTMVAFGVVRCNLSCIGVGHGGTFGLGHFGRPRRFDGGVLGRQSGQYFVGSRTHSHSTPCRCGWIGQTRPHRDLGDSWTSSTIFWFVFCGTWCASRFTKGTAKLIPSTTHQSCTRRRFHGRFYLFANRFGFAERAGTRGISRARAFAVSGRGAKHRCRGGSKQTGQPVFGPRRVLAGLPSDGRSGGQRIFGLVSPM